MLLLGTEWHSGDTFMCTRFITAGVSDTQVYLECTEIVVLCKHLARPARATVEVACPKTKANKETKKHLGKLGFVLEWVVILTPQIAENLIKP